MVGRCTTGIDPANKPDARVTKYCQCVYQSAASRWTYSDYQSHQGDYEKILDAEVAPGCEKSALGAIAGLRRIL